MIISLLQPLAAWHCETVALFFKYTDYGGGVANKEQFPSFWDNFGHKEWAGWG